MTTRRDLSEEVWSRLLQAHARVVPVLDAELRSRHQLPLSSYDVLLVLRRAPEGRLTMTDLSSCVVLSRSRVSRVIDELESAGLVTREENPDDRRSSFVSLTAAGRARQRSAGPALLHLIEDNVASGFSNDELALLADLLGRLAHDGGRAERPTRPRSG